MKKIVRKRHSLIVIGCYSIGMVLGLIGALSIHLNIITHPHQIPAADIILHNWGVIGIMLVGVFSLGLVSLCALFVNGLLLGTLLGGYAIKGKLVAILLALAPHGILEIGAFGLACYGDMLLVSCLWSLFHFSKKNIGNSRKTYFLQGMLANLLALFLLIIAGYIEHTLFLTA